MNEKEKRFTTIERNGSWFIVDNEENLELKLTFFTQGSAEASILTLEMINMNNPGYIGKKNELDHYRKKIWVETWVAAYSNSRGTNIFKVASQDADLAVSEFNRIWNK